MTGPTPDTICAVTTPPGVGGIAVVRVSGPEALGVLDSVLEGPGPSHQASNTVRLAWARDRTGRRIDQVMVAVFRKPRSYTGENMAEISCHGGRVAATAVIELLKQNGCRLAEPGEFTRRAVLAGKLTLSQAEAVLDMIHARSRAAYRSALHRYQGGLSELVSDLTGELRELLAAAEYHLGFDESDTPRSPGLRPRQQRFIRRLNRVITSGEKARLLHDGAEVVIIGRPNVGKSSLFNRLLETDRALVTSRPGTTRDRIEATVAFGDVPVRLSDTSGITSRRSGGVISRLASEQTGQALGQADLVLSVFDRSEPARAADRRVLKFTDGLPVVHVVNKTDKPTRLDPGFLNGRKRSVASVSALTGCGIARLRTMIGRRFRVKDPGVAANNRCLEAMNQCRDAVKRSLDAPDAETSAFELRAALDSLTVMGAPVASGEILDRVFARFCVGK